MVLACIAQLHRGQHQDGGADREGLRRDPRHRHRHGHRQPATIGNDHGKRSRSGRSAGHLHPDLVHPRHDQDDGWATAGPTGTTARHRLPVCSAHSPLVARTPPTSRSATMPSGPSSPRRRSLQHKAAHHCARASRTHVGLAVPLRRDAQGAGPTLHQALPGLSARDAPQSHQVSNMINAGTVPVTIACCSLPFGGVRHSRKSPRALGPRATASPYGSSGGELVMRLSGVRFPGSTQARNCGGCSLLW